MTGMDASSSTATPVYRIEAVETAVRATIRQVTSPAVRQVMWEAWQSAIASAAADSPDVMPWEKATETTVITEHAADRAMVKVLEAITDIEFRHRVRDILALECEFIEAEGDEGIRVTCQKCGTSYRARSTRSKWCGKSCRQSAYKARRAERETQGHQEGDQGQPGSASASITSQSQGTGSQARKSTTTASEDRADIAQQSPEPPGAASVPDRASA
jgi:hypothetical protein